MVWRNEKRKHLSSVELSYVLGESTLFLLTKPFGNPGQDWVSLGDHLLHSI